MNVAITKKPHRPSWMTPFGHEGWGDVFFDRLWPEWRRDMGEEYSPSIDFKEKDGRYFLTAELPGLGKDDISISVDNGYITLSGKKEVSNNEEGTNYYLKETRYGAFSRSFRLPVEVDEENIDATYRDGVLTVVIPQKEDAKRKKIKIK